MEKIRINGSICLTDLLKEAKAGHSAFSKAGNGKIYCNFTGWCNDNKDDFKDFSLQLNSTKEKSDAEGKVYFGNGKIKPNQNNFSGEPLSQQDTNDLDCSDLPF